MKVGFCLYRLERLGYIYTNKIFSNGGFYISARYCRSMIVRKHPNIDLIAATTKNKDSWKSNSINLLIDWRSI